MEEHELGRYGVPGLGEAVEALGMEWHHLPVPDVGVPDGRFEARWTFGDAFGYAIEFDTSEAIRRRWGPGGVREPVLHAGRLVVSDDTQMALFTLEGLLRAVGPDGAWSEDGVVAEARRAYLDWLDTQSGGAPSRG